MDKHRIDSHKLMFHVPRVNDWLKGERIYPIYMEVSPSGTCNHRCTFCALDFMEYQKRYLDPDLMKERLLEMGRLGVKSIMYAGEGEPFLNRHMPEIIEQTKMAGIDVAITTNGVLLRKDITERVLENTEWIKVSINAARGETYSKIHRTRPSDLDRVIGNMSHAARIRQRNNCQCALGMQLLLLPENRDDVRSLAEIARDIGMDYLVVKPYSQHPLSKTERYKDMRYGELHDLVDSLEGFNRNGFNVIVRSRTIQKWDEGFRSYDHCLALPFWSYIDAGGDVWGCSVYLGDERFHYGNIRENTFQEIWEGDKRENSLRWVEERLNSNRCRVNCRMDEVNRYLWELKHPSGHVNFI